MSHELTKETNQLSYKVTFDADGVAAKNFAKMLFLKDSGVLQANGTYNVHFNAVLSYDTAWKYAAEFYGYGEFCAASYSLTRIEEPYD